MTLRYREAHEQYQVHDQHRTPYARVANETYEAFRELAKAEGLKVPNDDRAEDLVAHLFAALWDHNHRTQN